MKLSIIIVNWNSGKKLLDCILSLINGSFNDFNCYIVDNNSNDGSIGEVCSTVRDLRIKYILNESNLGFGKGCNLALRMVDSRYVLFLNPDTILGHNTIKEALYFIENTADVNVLGIKNLDLNNKVVPSCSRFPNTARMINDTLGLSKLAPGIFRPGTIMTDWDHLESRFVDHVIGAFYLVEYEYIKATGFFDERFFLYLEDLDLSKRIKSAGGKIFYNSQIEIIHEGGGTSMGILSLRLFYSLQSRILFCEKYNNELNAGLITFFSAVIEPFIRLIALLLKLRPGEIKNICKSYYMLFCWLRHREKDLQQ